MKKVTLIIFFASFNLDASFCQSKISTCYKSFSGLLNYSIDSIERMPFGVRKYESFKISNNKQITIYIKDSYTISYIDSAKNIFFRIQIKLSQNKNYKDYLLENYKLIGEHHKFDHNEEGLVEITYGDFKLFGFNPVTLTAALLARYVLFPNAKTAIFIDFFNPTKSANRFTTIGDFKKERDQVISSYINFIKGCEL